MREDHVHVSKAVSRVVYLRNLDNQHLLRS